MRNPRAAHARRAGACVCAGMLTYTSSMRVWGCELLLLSVCTAAPMSALVQRPGMPITHVSCCRPCSPPSAAVRHSWPWTALTRGSCGQSSGRGWRRCCSSSWPRCVWPQAGMHSWQLAMALWWPVNALQALCYAFAVLAPPPDSWRHCCCCLVCVHRIPPRATRAVAAAAVRQPRLLHDRAGAGRPCTRICGRHQRGCCAHHRNSLAGGSGLGRWRRRSHRPCFASSRTHHRAWL